MSKYGFVEKHYNSAFPEFAVFTIQTNSAWSETLDWSRKTMCRKRKPKKKSRFPAYAPHCEPRLDGKWTSLGELTSCLSSVLRNKVAEQPFHTTIKASCRLWLNIRDTLTYWKGCFWRRQRGCFDRQVRLRRHIAIATSPQPSLQRSVNQRGEVAAVKLIMLTFLKPPERVFCQTCACVCLCVFSLEVKQKHWKAPHVEGFLTVPLSLSLSHPPSLPPSHLPIKAAVVGER